MNPDVILVSGVLMALALIASLFATRIRVPVLIAFLGLGMAVGSDGLGWIALDNYELARDIGVVALLLILLEGGLSTGFERLRPVWPVAVTLATLGTLLTAIVTGFVASVLFGFSLLESMLLGSIVASTDAAAVFGVLRHSTLRERLARILEGEAGSNDPIAILLVLGFIEWLDTPDYAAIQMVTGFVASLGIGLAAGVALGAAAVWSFNRLNLATAGLYPVASLAAAAIGYGVTEALSGSGFLAVYIIGLVLGSADIPARRTIVAFHEGMGWIAQVVMFLTLGLLVFPGRLDEVAVEGTALALVLVFIVRPLAVMICTAPFRMELPERVLLSWAGLRGAVPVVLATFAVIAAVPHSSEFFDIVFFSVLVSTVLQGTTFEPLARRLGVASDERPPAESPIEVGTIRNLGAEVVECEIGTGDAASGVRVRDLDLPRGALISIIVREGRAITPRGSTRVQDGDHLYVLANRKQASALDALIERWRDGPIGPPPRPEPDFRGSPPVFLARPRNEGRDGPAGDLSRVDEEDVIDVLRTRVDQEGALLLLADGRYALTGEDDVSVGSPLQLVRHVESRLERADAAEHDWLEEVIGALAAERGPNGPDGRPRRKMRSPGR